MKMKLHFILYIHKFEIWNVIRLIVKSYILKMEVTSCFYFKTYNVDLFTKTNNNRQGQLYGWQKSDLHNCQTLESPLLDQRFLILFIHIKILQTIYRHNPEP